MRRPRSWSARRRSAPRRPHARPRATSRPTAGEPRAPPSDAFPDLGALLALVDGLRGQLPPELARQLSDALRELLIAIRAVIDYTIEHLEPAAAPRARGGGHPDPMSLVPKVKAPEGDAAEPPLAAVALGLSMFLPWYQKSFFQAGKSCRPTCPRSASSRSSRPRSCSSRWRSCSSSGRARTSARFHLPGGDGVAITMAGGWAALLLVWRCSTGPPLGVGVDPRHPVGPLRRVDLPRAG